MSVLLGLNDKIDELKEKFENSDETPPQNTTQEHPCVDKN